MKETKMKTTASTNGPDGSRSVTLDPLIERTLLLKAKRVESSLTAGFRQNWLSGEGEDGLRFEVDCGAGVGSPYLMLSVTMPDGEHRYEVADIRPIVQRWVEEAVRDATPPWWHGQYPVGTLVDLHGDSDWLAGEVIECDDKGVRIAYQHEAKDGPFTMWVHGAEIPMSVRHRV